MPIKMAGMPLINVNDMVAATWVIAVTKYYLDDEKNLPIGNMRVSLLDTKCHESAECASYCSETKPISHAQTHLFLGIKEREIQRDGGSDC